MKVVGVSYVIILTNVFFTYSSKMGKTRKPRDFLMKRKDVLKQKKPRPPSHKVLSPFGMMEIMKQKNPEEFAQALRNLKKICMVCENTYYGHGTPHADGVICVDCMDCFKSVDITEQSIKVVREYRRSRDGRRTRTEKFADKQNSSQICSTIALPEGKEGTDTEHSPRDETPENTRQTSKEE